MPNARKSEIPLTQFWSAVASLRDTALDSTHAIDLRSRAALGALGELCG